MQTDHWESRASDYKQQAENMTKQQADNKLEWEHQHSAGEIEIKRVRYLAPTGSQTELEYRCRVS